MRWRSTLLPVVFLLSLLPLMTRGATNSGFKICSYKVQKFNKAKASNFRLMHSLTKIVSRYDITVLQDVMDPAVIKSLLAALNRYEEFTYESVSSKSLGNSPDSMQQYVFVYRTQTVNVSGQFQYDKKQAFVRNPFAVEFQSKKTAIKKFVLVAFLAEPKQAVQEMNRLYDVFLAVSKNFDNRHVMFVGDFHAGCAYMTRQDKKKIKLFTNTSFSWLIGDKMDTTSTEETHCPYDRMVVFGEPFLKGIVPFSGKVVNIARDFKLTMSKVRDLSSNLPLEVYLKGSAPLLKATAPLLKATPLLILASASVIVQSFLSAL
ncbi:deoxyribonuclease-1-like isoform X2 [Brachionichthys hirsutus]|uniref:deoxyribonuclease-1-like isoform X2 n=1 Tax=Brachionichthys hirsutus TaxID=412623 RepID=UPI0036050722